MLAYICYVLVAVGAMVLFYTIARAIDHVFIMKETRIEPVALMPDKIVKQINDNLFNQVNERA